MNLSFDYRADLVDAYCAIEEKHNFSSINRERGEFVEIMR